MIFRVARTLECAPQKEEEEKKHIPLHQICNI